MGFFFTSSTPGFSVIQYPSRPIYVSDYRGSTVHSWAGFKSKSHTVYWRATSAAFYCKSSLSVISNFYLSAESYSVAGKRGRSFPLIRESNTDYLQLEVSGVLLLLTYSPDWHWKGYLVDKYTRSNLHYFLFEQSAFEASCTTTVFSI